MEEVFMLNDLHLAFKYINKFIVNINNIKSSIIIYNECFIL